MTVFLTNDIPSSVNTYEKLVVWAISALRANYPALERVEAAGYVERVVQLNTFFVPPTQKQIVLARVSFEIDPAFQGAQTGKFWTFTQDLGTVAILPGFKSN